MEIEGIIKHVLPRESGIGKNGEWNRQYVVIETDGDYPRKIAVNLSGKSLEFADKKNVLQIGNRIKCQIDIESREFNGKWYTQLNVWRLEI